LESIRGFVIQLLKINVTLKIQFFIELELLKTLIDIINRDNLVQSPLGRLKAVFWGQKFLIFLEISSRNGKFRNILQYFSNSSKKGF